MKIEVTLHGLNGILNTLRSLPPEIVSKNGGPARVALRKGAMILVKQAKANFRAAVASPGKSGITKSLGFTEKHIIAKRKAPREGINGERYIVTVKPVPYPVQKLIRRKSRSAGKRKKRAGPKPRVLAANDIAFIMEHGSLHQPATPWLLPAFNAKKEEVLATVEKDLIRGIDKIVKKLAAQNQGK